MIVRAFPSLFAYGIADLFQPRKNKIEKVAYFKFLMQYKNRRFATDPRFRFYAMNMIMRHEAMTDSRLFIKKSIFPKMSTDQILNLIKTKPDIMKSIYIVGNKLRGMRPFCRSKYNDLKVMVKQLGPPQIYFTLSAADGYWPALYKLLSPDVHYDLLTNLEKRQLLIDNPDIVSYFFQKRTELFMKYVMIPLFGVTDS